MTFIPSTVVASGRAFGPSCSGLFPLTPAGHYPRLGSFTTDANGVLYYVKPGSVWPYYPMPGLVGSWNYAHFWDVDYARCGVANIHHAVFVGDGDATFHVKSGHLGSGDRPPPYFFDIVTGYYVVGVGSISTVVATHVSAGDGTGLIDVTVPLRNAKRGFECCQWVQFKNLVTDVLSWDGNVGFDGVDWAPLDTGGAIITGSVTMPHAI